MKKLYINDAQANAIKALETVVKPWSGNLAWMNGLAEILNLPLWYIVKVGIGADPMRLMVVPDLEERYIYERVKDQG